MAASPAAKAAWHVHRAATASTQPFCATASSLEGASSGQHPPLCHLLPSCCVRSTTGFICAAQQLTSTSHSSLGYGFKTKELDDSGEPGSSDSEVRLSPFKPLFARQCQLRTVHFLSPKSWTTGASLAAATASHFVLRLVDLCAADAALPSPLSDGRGTSYLYADMCIRRPSQAPRQHCCSLDAMQCSSSSYGSSGGVLVLWNCAGRGYGGAQPGGRRERDHEHTRQRLKPWRLSWDFTQKHCSNFCTAAQRPWTCVFSCLPMFYIPLHRQVCCHARELDSAHTLWRCRTLCRLIWHLLFR